MEQVWQPAIVKNHHQQLLASTPIMVRLHRVEQSELPWPVSTSCIPICMRYAVHCLSQIVIAGMKNPC